MSRIFEHLEIPQPPYRMKRPLAVLASMEEPAVVQPETPPPPLEKPEEDAFEKLPDAAAVDTRLADMAQAAALALEEKKSPRRSELLRAVAEAGEQYAAEVKAGGGKLHLNAEQTKVWLRLMEFKKRSDAQLKPKPEAPAPEAPKPTEPAAPAAAVAEMPPVEMPAVIMPKIEIPPPPPVPEIPAPGPQVKTTEAAERQGPAEPTADDLKHLEDELERIKITSPEWGPAKKRADDARNFLEAKHAAGRKARGPRMNLAEPKTPVTAERPQEQTPSPNELLRQTSRETQEALNLWRQASEEGKAPKEELERLKQAYRAASDRLAQAREAARGATREAPSVQEKAVPAEKPKGRLYRRQINMLKPALKPRRSGEASSVVRPGAAEGDEGRGSARRTGAERPDDWESVEDIKAYGIQRGPGIRERFTAGFAGEGKDTRAFLNRTLAGRSKDRLEALRKQAEQLQRDINELNKGTFWDRLRVGLWHEGRLNALQRKGAAEYSRWEKYRNKQDDFEAQSFARKAERSKIYDAIITSCEERAERAEKQAELRVRERARLYDELECMESALSRTADEREKSEIQDAMSDVKSAVAAMDREIEPLQKYSRTERQRRSGYLKDRESIRGTPPKGVRAGTDVPDRAWIDSGEVVERAAVREPGKRRATGPKRVKRSQ